jgi:hypothetical protein
MMAMGLGRSLPNTLRHQWERLADIHAAMMRLHARITVAGQWRNFTALPEHSESGQKVSG